MKIQTLGLTQPEKRNSVLENPAVPLSSVAQWEFLGAGSDTEAAEIVNTNTALQLSTVFSCVKILAESVSSLPLNLYSKTATGRTLETAHPLSYLLGSEPNPEMDYVSWMEVCMSHLALTGNSYCQIQRDAEQNPIALWPLSPRQTHPYRLKNNQLVYRTEDGGVQRMLAAADVLHVKTISFDGLLGMSPILQCKRLLGGQIAAEKYGSRFFANNATPSGILTMPATMKVKPEDKPKMRADWESQQAGSNQHRVNILDQGATYQQISISPEEGQFLEVMQFNRAQIGSIYRISSHLLGSETRQTDANVESMNSSFLSQTLNPYLVKFESEISKKLLPRTPGQHSTASTGAPNPIVKLVMSAT
ncbi:phage portal protein [Tunturiibacter gelidiferens]|uniref:phage portal protein n=1 Tax=Tunturiibacter gelidiferens TaxID=3069689 RepID=UPI003D9BD4DE